MKKLIILFVLILAFSCNSNTISEAPNFKSEDICMGQRIKQAREDKNLSKAEFSNLTDISITTVELIENCDATPIHTKWEIIEETLSIKLKSKEKKI